MNEQKHVLIVDDSTAIQKFASFSLKMIDIRVTNAEDGMIAMEQLSQNVFDLLIVDLNMPNIDGYSLIESVRSSDDYYDVPIIVLTSDRKPESMKKAIDLGADIFLQKPFDKDMIQTEVVNLLNNKRRT